MEKNEELPWIAEARKFIGLREIPGPEHAPEILQMWRDIRRSGIKDDETPWCAAFAGSMLERTGIRSTRFEGARSYLEWGEKLDKPIYGCVVVFSRSGGGHVGFVVGKTDSGNLLVLGGNQSDAVNIRAFSTDRVTGYRWPEGYQKPNIPLPSGNADMSTNEA
ncbi:TIGR02594 family protein [Enterobacter sp. WCHEn045836]|uniref:TIGR02594 family protein n=1 Tax=Enterobacter sp. WCHEn045836 TaxID=2497434 RepID=UPI000F82FA62|nr:TIGR02594 family protein [Enterobacter sp. WCHEn045836]RTQ01319.1 TIGR02594 family protein [Enterobacter sp. WCHEn045836]